MRHQPGTLIQHRNGYVYLITKERKQVAYHRFVAAQRLGRDLRDGEVVVRKKPDFLNNKWDNLVVVQHRLEKFKYLPEPRLIFVPGKKRVINANRTVAGAG